MSPLLFVHFYKGTQLVKKSKIGFVHSIKLLNNILFQISNIHNMYHPFPVLIHQMMKWINTVVTLLTMLYHLNAMVVENP